MRLILGHYTDVHSVFAGRVGGSRGAQSVIDDNGHYSDIRSITTGRESGGARRSVVDHYHYIDIDRVNADSGGGGDQVATDPGGGEQAARSRGYEGLDLVTLRQPPRPHDYAGLGAGENAASTLQTDEQIEMNVDPGGGEQAARSRGYEGLDPSVLATLRQPPRPHDYAGLGAGESAASTQQTTEQIEMNAFDACNEDQNMVS